MMNCDICGKKADKYYNIEGDKGCSECAEKWLKISKTEIIQRVRNYVKLSAELIKCRQKHFRQVCHKCKEYPNCKVYLAYYDSWVELQEIADL